MNDQTRPLPKLTELDTAPFWEGTKEKEFRYQQCEHCDAVIFYPRAHCTACTDGKLTWKTASGKGSVYSYSIVRQSYHPFFRNRVPYVVAWVDLEEGPRILSNVTGPIEEVSVGAAVALEWEEHEEVNIPLFRLV